MAEAVAKALEDEGGKAKVGTSCFLEASASCVFSPIGSSRENK